MTIDGGQRAAALAAEPLRPAGAQPGFFRGTVQSLRDIAAHRELLGLLVRRELKARYKDSVLGFFWTLARPLAMLLVYYVAIGKFLGAERVPGRETGIPDFAIFVFTGLTAWQLFSEIISTGTSSIVGNAGLIKKVYLPREVFPLSAVGAALVNFTVQLGILVAATAVLGRFPTGSRWLLLPLALAVLVVYSTALAVLLSAINVYLRDVQYLVEILIMILFWASPIVYSWGLVESHLSPMLAQLYLANPMTQVVLAFQRVFWVSGTDEPTPPDLAGTLGVTLVISIVLLWLAQRVFARLQSNFAQEL
ncbi:ABC transporter permease [Actinotalea sp. M2MS4P-6]|uniref:ABC transporter permease n=1 Tax=Actinotalea sp. M2MS4P-6 TaxID=2983762 RepID=UPI0021E514BD|nr:ABC transporter permease [Actinotalea sp. M2MS4P-6]MCV2395833.1 ABC transporter permease [Actinotalea sp. M2MS4P-6]